MTPGDRAGALLRSEAGPDPMRERLAETVRTIIVQRGLEAVTVRTVARELGYTGAVVQHHFANKREMMLFTNAHSMRLATAIVEAAAEQHPHSVLRCVEAYLPLDEIRATNWRVWIAFWGLSIADRELAARLKAGTRVARDFVRARIVALQGAGSIPAALDSAQAAIKLLNTMQGIAIQAVFDPVAWPAERQCALMDAECRRLLQSPSA